MTPLLLDAAGLPLPAIDGVVHATERSILHIRAASGWSITLAGRPLPWSAEDGGARIQLPFAAGAVPLVLRRDGVEIRQSIEILPAAHKLGPELWEALLDDLERWWPGTTAGVEGARKGGLLDDGADVASAIEALLPLVPAFEHALAHVVKAPRTLERAPIVDRPLREARAIDGALSAWVASHPDVAQWLGDDPPPSGRPPLLPLPTPSFTVDAPENRHVAWLARAVARRLRAGADALAMAACSDLNETRSWIEARVAALSAAARRIDRTVERSPLARLTPEPASDAAVLALLGAPAYERVQRIGRKLLRLRFTLEADDAVATRPTYDLYEVWCLLAAGRAVREILGERWTWAWYGLDAIARLTGTGAGARLSGRRDDGATADLSFNLTFQSMLTQKDPTRRHAISGERRPDLTLTLTGEGRARFLVLDAKYVGDRPGLAAAFDAAHLYRDALRWPAFGGRARGAFLLVPSLPADCAPWGHPSFLREHCVGAILARPGADAGRALHEALAPWIRDGATTEGT